MLKEQIKNHYDSVASDWRSKVWVKDPGFRRTIKSFANVSHNSKLLDVGIGAGDFSSLFDVTYVVGIDISRNHLAECRRLHPQASVLLADAEQMPFKGNRFDVVCARNLLQNLQNPTRVVDEMLRTLKPGGKLISVESAVFEHERQFPTAVCRVVEPFHPLFPSHEFLRKIFTDSGQHSVEQTVTKVHRKWLGGWQESKHASDRQRAEIYQICEQYPDWYKEKYEFRLFPDELEVESSMTFSLIRLIKSRA